MDHVEISHTTKNTHAQDVTTSMDTQKIILNSTTISKFIPSRSCQSRKGQNGTVLVVGGGYMYHGAPILSSLAALRCCADLVYTAVPKINVTATRAASPDLIVIPMADPKLTRGSAAKLLGILPNGLDSAAIGMGLVVHERGALIRLVKSLVAMDVRICLDAGALIPEILPIIPGTNTIVTPHPGEFKRLFGRDIPPHHPSTSNDEKDRIVLVEEMARKYGVTVILKGKTDIISDGGSTTYLCKRGVPAMTTGGTGDILSGLVAGMLSINRNPLEAAATAAFINGMAGEMVQNRLGLHMVATDMLEDIPKVMITFDRTTNQ